MGKKHEKYEYINAIVDCGNLHWEYKVEGLRASRMSHDEDVEEWSDKDIIDLTVSILDVPEDQKEIIKVEYA